MTEIPINVNRESRFLLKSVEEIKAFLGEGISKVYSFEEKDIHVVNIIFDPNMKGLREFVRKIESVVMLMFSSLEESR
mgnify:CR=1 FL=1